MTLKGLKFDVLHSYFYISKKKLLRFGVKWLLSKCPHVIILEADTSAAQILGTEDLKP